MRRAPGTEGAVREVVAQTLGIPRAAVVDELSFRSIPQWDSIGHVELMLALEELWGEEIDADLVVELTSVRAILDMSARQVIDRGDRPEVHRGLSGLHVDDTRISEIDAEDGRLAYRGYAIEELLVGSTFEETAFLLLHGELPTPMQLRTFAGDLGAARRLSPAVEDLLRPLSRAVPLETLRSVVSALPAVDPSARAGGELATAVRLVGQVPAIIGSLQGAQPAAAELPHAAAVLAALTGRVPDPDAARIFEQTLILLAEHGANASAFAARVAVGTGGDLHAAVTAAIAVFGGPLHGGAIEGVVEMVAEIGDPSRAAGYVRDLRSRQQPVIGLGHRLYTREDPRAAFLRATARDLAERSGDTTGFRILEEVRAAMHPYTRFGVDVNVDFYAGLVLTLLGVPARLLSAAFAASRVVGWAAHAIEQRRHNVLIRPLLRYVGEDARAYVPLEDRDERQRLETSG